MVQKQNLTKTQSLYSNFDYLTINLVIYSQKWRINPDLERDDKMLIEFNIENFKSIKDRVTLSLVSSKDDSLSGNLIKTKELKEDSLLKSAVIYGANASGKTNIIYAFPVLSRLILTSHNNQKGDSLEYIPFRLDDISTKKPTKMEVFFIKKGIKYQYGLSYNHKKILNEYLYYFPNGRKSLIFKRSNTSKFQFTIDKEEQKKLANQTRENVLYLSRATQLNYKKTSDAFDWFKYDLDIIGPTDQLDPDKTIRLMNKDKKLKKIVLKALIEADVGIEDISGSIKKIKPEDLPSDFPKELKKLLISTKKKGTKVEIKTLHHCYFTGGKKVCVPFTFDEESDGTQRIFSLIGPWINAIVNGRILIVDELDTKLHHKLNVLLIKLFNNPTQNKNNAQLVFTTHNTNLLDLNIFRRDQIWFTEKNPKTKSTNLYSLLEFSPRKADNIQKGYLLGRYGAIPFIKNGTIF